MIQGFLEKIVSSTAKPGVSRRALMLKAGFSALAMIALIGQFSQALSSKFTDDNASTVLPARIRAARLFSITAEVPGAVASVAVMAGDKVEAGQELAVLASPEIALALERAKKRLARAQERVDSRTGNDHRLRIYSEQYSAAEAAWKLACYRASQFETGNQERMYAHYNARLKAVEKLGLENLATPAEIERSRREEQDTLQNLKAAREHHSRLRQECDASLAQVRVAKLQLELHRNSETDSVQAEYDEASAQLNVLMEQEKRLRIIARNPGTVLSTLIAPGERVAAGSALFQMGDVRELSIEVPVDAAIARNVNKGDRVSVRLPTHPPQQIEAAVASVVLAPGDDARSYVVRVLIPNPDPRTILAGLEGAVAFRHTGWGVTWAKLPF